MKEFLSKITPEQSLKAKDLGSQYWSSFSRDPIKGRATTSAGPKIILPANVLAISIVNKIEETLGEVGANMVLYDIGKAWGSFVVEHMAEWAQSQNIQGDHVKMATLYFPMQVGLTPRLDLTTLDYQGQECMIATVHTSILSETRHKNGLSTKPAHWMVSGWVAGCISSQVGRNFEARAIPHSGETTYRILVALGHQLSHFDLNDPIWVSNLGFEKSFTA